ncbi:cytochrome P450 [Micromonospora sp. NBRC 101691]|uniref:cytochrome P450 n=1 Tax=Micromonospora TaxID=1873 RepID=UPI0024A18575|nr:cytochrome P450 [Micromonospora sp. NBRC 101691]GLY26204.1 cytochrome P450 [Micromonospora sp. NBRC 101691]
MTGQQQVNLADVELFVRGEHPEAFRHLRATSPVHWNQDGQGGGFWALTRYEDVLWAYREHTTLSSEGGAVLGGSFRKETDSAAGRMLVASDLPRHRLLKQQLHPALSQQVAQRVSRQVDELVGKALRRALAAGGCDFATDVAAELPAGALMVITGVSHTEAHRLIGMTRRMVGYRDELYVDTGDNQRLRLAWLQAEIFEFFADLVEHRRRHPGDDLVSLLLGSRINGRPVSEEEILFNCLNVAVGGNETSAHTACAAVQAFIDHPDQRELLCRDPGLMPGAVEEVLRWASTNAYVQRVAKQDIRRGDVLIRTGDSVTLWNVSANHDESEFTDPERFDILRSPNRHLSYGAGLHRCIGAPVAQEELTVLLRRVLLGPAQFSSITPPVRMRSNFILGVQSMPLEIR